MRQSKLYSLSNSISALFHTLLIVLVAITTTACHYANEDDAWTVNSEAEVDSVEFRKMHHYWKGYNFVATDSFNIVSRPPFEPQLTFTADQTFLIKKHDVIAIEDIRKDTTQTPYLIWLKIAAVESSLTYYEEGGTMSGWIKESQLMQEVVPDTPVSKIIHSLGSRAFKVILFATALVLGLCLLVFLRRKSARLHGINSSYPPLLYVLLSGCVVLHRSIWHYVPDTWIEYYFYPTLNPFNQEQPLIISLFLTLIWLLILVAIAVIEDLRRKINTLGQLTSNLLLFCGHCVVIFATFAVIAPFALLYPLLITYWIYVVYLYHRHYKRVTYYCGNCGAPLHQLGECTECGAQNK